jgi:hypothetical protein
MWVKSKAPARPTVCVAGAGAGVDSVREQEKPEARTMIAVGAAESPASSARFASQPFCPFLFLCSFSD